MAQNNRQLSEGSQRVRALRNLLTRLRSREMARLKELRRDQAEDVLTEPSDELEVARSASDVEVHASLVGRTEDWLKAIEGAFEALDQGRYGICEKCRREIPLARLRARPFAAFCTECQKKRDETRKQGTIDEESLHRWTVPEGMETPLPEEESAGKPEEQAKALSAAAFAPPSGGPETRPGPVTTRRRQARRGKPKPRRKPPRR